MSTYSDFLAYYGISDTNTVLNKDMLLDGLSGALKGYSEEDIKEIVSILQDNPERDKDKKAIMKKSGRESSIKETTGQGLGDVIDNMPYYVDSCAWWLNGWNSAKYKARLKRDAKKYIADTVGEDNINPRTGLPRTRRKQIPRRIRGKK